MDLTVLSLSPHLTSCLLEKLLSSFGISARRLAAGFLLLFCVFYLRLLKSYTHGRVFFDFQPTNRAFQPKFFYFAPVRYAWKLVYHWPETLNVIWRNKFVFRFCDFFLIIKVFAVEVRYFPSKNYVFFFFNAFFLPGNIYWWHNFSEFLKIAYLQTHSHPLQECFFFFFCFSNSNTLWRVPILSQST